VIYILGLTRSLGTINRTALETCLQRVAEYAKNNNANVHMSQIWFGLQNLTEQQTLSLIRKNICAKGINAYIYAFRRGPRTMQQKRRFSAKPPALTGKRPRNKVNYAVDDDKKKKDEDETTNISDIEEAESQSPENVENSTEDKEEEEEYEPDQYSDTERLETEDEEEVTSEEDWDADDTLLPSTKRHRRN
jgi:hypothetical protein